MQCSNFASKIAGLKRVRKSQADMGLPKEALSFI
jgi:hypothetical protein